MGIRASCVVVGLLCGACSSSSASPAGAAGNGSGGGGGGTGVMQGAISLDFLAPSTCTVPAVSFDLPAQASGRAVTATQVGQLMPADASMAVDCHTVPGSSPSTVWGSITAGASEYVSFEANMVIGQDVLGSLSVMHPTLGTQYGSMSGTPCYFNASELAPGKVWAKFHCPTAVDFVDTSVCAVGDSYLYFENCSLMN